MFPNGDIEQLLGEEDISNGVQGYNSTSINVAYVGGIDSKGRPTDNRTKAQKKSLVVLLTAIKRDYPQAHIMGHRDIWGKDKSKWKKMCPCFDAEAEYAYLDNIGKPGAKPNDYVQPKPQKIKKSFWEKIMPWTN